MVKVSVIVPVYNGEAHLEECLDRICGQTLRDIEILCVDDGSTDSSLAILERYRAQDGRISVYQQQHRYAGVARNLGKSHAVGEYLAFWDSDDLFDPEALEKLYARAESVQADVCVCGGNRYFESNGKTCPWPAYLSWKKVPAEGWFNRFTNPDHYLDFTNVAPWNKLFRREYIEQLGLDFKPVKTGNDVYFTVNALGLADRITALNERLVTYRVNQSSGLTRTLDQDPTAPVQTWIETAENLEKYDGFGERSFANRALGLMIYLLQNLREWDSFQQTADLLRGGALERLHIRPAEPGYYNSDWRDSCVRILYEGTAQDLAVFFSYTMYQQKMDTYAEKQTTSRALSDQKALTREQKAQIRDLKAERKTLKEERKALRAEKKDLSRQLKAEKEEKKKLEEQLRQRTKERDRLDRELTQTRNSWSYRIGHAMMWLPGRIRRLFRRKQRA